MDSHNHSGTGAWLQRPSAECCSLPPTGLGAPCRLVLLGAPGVGKGTQAVLLSRRLGACHLSTGDVFRAVGRRRECERTPAMTAAIEYMRRGALVPDSTVWEILQERSGCLRCRSGFILDGFPRTLGQAKALMQLTEEERLPLSAIVNYNLPMDEIVSRLSGRRTCQDCKSVFHVTGQPPGAEGLCDHCGGLLYQREDDRPESIAVRLDVYRSATAPLIEFYTDLGMLMPIVATGSPDTICARTMAALEARRLTDYSIRSYSSTLSPVRQER